MDLLDHEVLPAALFSALAVPSDLRHFLLHFVTVEVVEGNLPFLYPGHFKIAQIADIP